MNKGDSESPNVGKDGTLYAATPPLAALQYVPSYAGTWGVGSSARRGVMIHDVGRAYVDAEATRDLYVELPAEDPEASSDVLGKLELCLCMIPAMRLWVGKRHCQRSGNLAGSSVVWSPVCACTC